MVRRSKKIGIAGILACVAAGCWASGTAHASTWNSTGTADWNTPANWTAGVPDLTVDGAVADLNSGTASYSGASFKLAGTTGVMTLNGGSFVWATATSSNYTNVYYRGRLTVNSGTFDAGASVLNVGSTATNGQGYVSVTGGNLNVSGMLNLNNDLSTISISGGSVSFGGSLYLATGSMTVSGGTLAANYITFATNDTISSHLTLSGGQINTKKAWLDTYGSTHYVDFTADSAGVLHYIGDTNGNIARTQIGSGVLRYNGAINAGAFTVTTDGTGSYIRLAAVPEPASAALLALPAAALLMRRKNSSV